MMDAQGEMFAREEIDDPFLWPEWFYRGNNTPACHTKRVSKGLHPLGSKLRPGDKTCRLCRHVVATGNGSKYLKCKAHEPWTHGPATDLRLKWQACERFEE